METSRFETGKSYGNDLTVKVISRTDSFITFETNVWGLKKCKIKTDKWGERVFFKSWLIKACEPYDAVISERNFYDRAYYS